MVQGTASHVGKSVLVSALCRILRQDGLRIAPFKAQNMSNNSYVTPDGGEIGRAQAVQAEAAGVDARVEMNPVLLKPEADSHAQVVLMGRPLTSAGARDYFDLKATLWDSVTSSLDTLRSQYDVVVIEGAGSPAEINLKATEIVNMRVALYADAPVLLCGDIDRGGVFASLLGTLQLLDPPERDAVKGFVINKFRGDVSLLTDGLTWLEEYTGKPVVGVVHHFPAVLDVAVVQVPHISNFDDFDPLDREPGVALRYVQHGDRLGHPDLVILPGSKTTIPDLLWMDQQGLSRAVTDAFADGSAVIGICGGYQMLGNTILDPDRVESSVGAADGLGLLPLVTTFAGTKETHRVRATVHPDAAMPGSLFSGSANEEVVGYEIHMGRTTGEGVAPAFTVLDRADAHVNPDNALDGAMDSTGRAMGTYIHGLFHNAGVRQALLNELARRKGVTMLPGSDVGRDREYDKLADWVRNSLNMDLVYGMLDYSPSP
ncbi:Cobyric acid synthase [Geodia barretti]|uniref:Cobyric acid synthase n=1 Tax=Geodia barretti TaxID=519541 RepID=A0AA35VRS2_GEOBA|nr:Cobyric acid synthase [Geodia barretti]